MNTVSPETATFSKAAPADVVLTVSSTATTNSITGVKLGAVDVDGANYTVAGLVVTLKQAYLATLAEAAHTFNIEMQSGNTVSSVVTVTA